jgi:uncharacterized protein DUF4235
LHEPSSARRIWHAGLDDEAPKATDAQRGWREVLLAAALQCAIFALVKVAVDRGAAKDTRKLTCVWPGNETGNPGGTPSRIR